MDALRRFLSWWIAELTALLPARRRGPVLRLPEGTALWRRLVLPEAAAGDLRAALAFEMDRQTPFTAAEVLFDCVVVERGGGHITVEMLLAPRAAVEQALAEARAAGIVPVAIEAAAPSAHRFNLLPVAGSGRRDRLAFALAMAAVLMLPAAFAVGLDRRQETARHLDAEAALARGRAGAAIDLRGALDVLDRDALALAERKATRPAMVLLLDELTRALPDEVWLTQLEIADGEAQLWGYAPSASAVVRQLEQSAILHRAEFRAPVVQEAGHERFHIVAKLRTNIVAKLPTEEEK
jgi:general secretion pathway protein L